MCTLLMLGGGSINWRILKLGSSSWRCQDWMAPWGCYRWRAYHNMARLWMRGLTNTNPSTYLRNKSPFSVVCFNSTLLMTVPWMVINISCQCCRQEWIVCLAEISLCRYLYGSWPPPLTLLLSSGVIFFNFLLFSVFVVFSVSAFCWNRGWKIYLFGGERHCRELHDIC